MGDNFYTFLILADLIAGFLIWIYLKEYFNKYGRWKDAVIKSLVYSLFFGIGALGEGGGDPGFMLPAPILPAAIIAWSEHDFQIFLQNAVIPYFIWTIIFFIYYAAREIFLIFKKRNG